MPSTLGNSSTFPRRVVRTVISILLILGFTNINLDAGQRQRIRKVAAKDVRQLIEQKKGKVVLVNYWATWCVPCLKEFPDLIKAYNKHKSQGLEIIGVSMNEASEMDELNQFLRKYKPPFPIYLTASLEDAFFTSVDQRWQGEIPLTMIYGRDGKLRLFHKEILDPAKLEEVLSEALGRPE